MYNSTNLPLSPKKVLKKSFGSVVVCGLSFLFPGVAMFMVNYTVKTELNAAYTLLVPVVITLLSLPRIVYQYLYYKLYFYNFGEESAEIRKGVVSRATGHVNYYKIQNIYLDQDVLDRFLGLYDVHYETAGLTSGFYSHVDGLVKSNADKLVEFLKQKANAKESASRITAEDAHRIETDITAEKQGSGEAVFSRKTLPIEKTYLWKNIITGIIGSLPISLFFVFFLLAKIGVTTIFPSLVFIIALFIATLTTIGSVIWYRNFNYWFDHQGGEIFTKVLSMHQTHIYFNRIQNVDLVQSIIDRLFGLYTLKIETAAEGTALSTLIIPGLNQTNAIKLKDFLLQKSQQHRSI